MQSPLPQSSQRKPKRRLWPFLSTILLLAIAVWTWTNQQLILDSVSYWQYSPTSQINTLTDRIALTDKGKFLFYATHPQMQGREAFNAKCGSQEHNAAILGCYAGDRIYLYDITDERLDGIKEVTAAHEMLHAVYWRMSADEKQTVNTLIEAEYAKMKDNKDLSERMDFYARTEPGERDNELHSIIGTELATVNPELEAHYAKYMGNRASVVGLYEGYHQEFTNLEQQRTALAARLDKLKSEFDVAVSAHEKAFTAVEDDISQFSQRTFTSQVQLGREEAALKRRIAAVNAERDRINTLAKEFNQLRDQYNQSLAQSNELYQSLDSKLSPAPQV